MLWYCTEYECSDVLLLQERVCFPVVGLTTGAMVAIVSSTLIFVFLFVVVIRLCYKYVALHASWLISLQVLHRYYTDDVFVAINKRLSLLTCRQLTAMVLDHLSLLVSPLIENNETKMCTRCPFSRQPLPRTGK